MHLDGRRRVYPEGIEYECYRLSEVANEKAAAIARELLFKE